MHKPNRSRHTERHFRNRTRRRRNRAHPDGDWPETARHSIEVIEESIAEVTGELRYLETNLGTSVWWSKRRSHNRRRHLKKNRAGPS